MSEVQGHALLVQRPAGAPQQLVLLFHGYGADAPDLAPIGQRLAREYPQALVVSVRAPEPCPVGGGYQWFSLDDISEQNRPGRIAAALPSFVTTVRHWQRQASLGADATVLVGFSQGATMAYSATIHPTADVLAGRVIALSGRYAHLPSAKPEGITFYIVHGHADEVIPYGQAQAAVRHLESLGADVISDFVPQLGHGIDAEVLELVVRRLRTHVPMRHWEAALRQGVPPPGGGTQ